MELALRGDTLKLVTGATSFGVGILAWEYCATSKYAGGSYGNLFDSGRFCDALAGLIGNKLVKKLNPSWTGAATFKPNVMGWLNKVTIVGAVIKVVNEMTRKYTGKLMDGADDLIDAAANGMIVGGVIGGIFDPIPSGGAASNTNQGLNDPTAVHVNAVEQHNRSIGVGR